MTRSRTARVKAAIPRDQRCEFLLGPVGSWLVPRSADIWSNSEATTKSPSWFIYGCKGCFCFGRVTREHPGQKQQSDNKFTGGDSQQQSNCCDDDGPMTPVALTDHIEYIKSDNSRVICCQFCKTQTNRPYAFILTENGSLLLYDCSTRLVKIRFDKSYIIQKILQATKPDDTDEDLDDDQEDEPSAKKLKFIQHISIVSWPDRNNAFLSVSMSKKKTSFILWLKIPDNILQQDYYSTDINEGDLIEFARLNTSSSCTNIVCMETMLLDNSNTVLIAVGFDDGLLNIIRLNKSTGPSRKVVELKRHSDQICSLSFWSFGSGNKHEYSSGLLASVSRDGLVLIWDIQNEYYFADYSINSTDSKDNYRKYNNNASNWFGLSFIKLNGMTDANVPYLTVSNSAGGLVNLEIPRKVHASKIRLNGNSNHATDGHTTKHRSIVFNASFDPNYNILMTTSLDNNLIFWNCSQVENNNSKKISPKLYPSYLLPTMANNARTHMMRFSPIANDHLALALGKAGLRFYKIPSERKDFRFQMTPGCSSACYEVYKQKLSPTSIAWQPNHEYRLAVGTLEGLVLRLDIKSSNGGGLMQSVPMKEKPNDGSDDPFNVDDVPQSDAASHNGNLNLKNKAIYSLCWGPDPLVAPDIIKLAIYSISSHALSIHVSKDEDRQKSKGNLLDLVKKMPERFSNISEFTSASEVSWKSSLDYMAIGTTDGRVIIIRLRGDMSSDIEDEDKFIFEKLVTIQDVFGSICIQSLAWHPTTYKDSDYYYYLAVASKEHYDLHIFDLRDTITSEEEKLVRSTLNRDPIDRSENAHITDSMICLTGHKHCIADVCWSPHEETQLCSCSFDTTSVVWQVEGNIKGENKRHRILSKFVARDRLFTAEWSTVDNDLILTSGQDSTLIAWRPSENMVDVVDDDCC